MFQVLHNKGERLTPHAFLSISMFCMKTVKVFLINRSRKTVRAYYKSAIYFTLGNAG